jgi:RNA 2',3'-cyclic 3'-phosphodiesterase
MNVIRAFIAIHLSPEITHNLEQVLQDLKSRWPQAPVRWVPANNIHITIKFLGDVSLSNVPLLTKMLQIEASRHASLEISVGKLGAFPSVRRPRVIWVGVEAPPELYTLQRSVEGEMARLGYAPEEREFSPHLTLGRVARNISGDEMQRLSALLAGSKVGFLGATRVQSIQLFRSDLQPNGAVYTALFTAPLAEAGSYK